MARRPFLAAAGALALVGAMATATPAGAVTDRISAIRRASTGLEVMGMTMGSTISTSIIVPSGPWAKLRFRKTRFDIRILAMPLTPSSRTIL